MSTWYHDHGGVRNGPFTLDEMRDELRLGHVLPDERAWSPEFVEWTCIREIPQLVPGAPARQPPGAPVPPLSTRPPRPLPSAAHVAPAADLLTRPVPITLLAVYQLLVAACLAVVAALLIAAGSRIPDSDPNDGVALIIGAVVGVVSLLMGAAGLGLLGLRPFARILSIVLAVPGLLGFPFGTFISIVVIGLLTRPAIALLFRKPRGESLSPRDVAQLTEFRRSAAWTALLAVALGLQLLVIPIAGIIAAIAVPNFLNAVQRGKQKRAMGDMRTIATAIESYSVDEEAYPRGESLEEIRGLLEPTYIRALPLRDPWQHDYEYQGAEDTYVVTSHGKDGAQGGRAGVGHEGATTSFDDDIVFSDGEFVTWPEGPQGSRRPAP